MVSITFVQSGGDRQTIDAEVGVSLMANAKLKGVDGIEAECGGSMVCGTCHVHLCETIYKAIGSVPTMEAEMLDYVIDPSPTSRLSCQVRVIEAMEGMEVRIPVLQR